MSRNWTENQLKAINASNGSLLVSAAAGSGKTAVLVERVIRMVTDANAPLPIDRLLVVTYTRAAASELQTRISNALGELIRKYPHNSWYRRQLSNLSQANISTVDSFCSKIVREFFQHLDISSDYRIADDGELAILRKNAVTKTLDRLYEEGSEEFYEMVESFSSARNDNKVTEIILGMYEFLRSHPFGSSWLDEKLLYYADVKSMSDSVWGKVIIEYAVSAVDYLIDLSKSSLKIMEPEPDLYSKVYSLIDRDILFLTVFRKKLQSGSWDDVSEHIGSFESGTLSAKGYKDHPIKLRVAANRDILKNTLKTLFKLFERNEAECLGDIAAQMPIVRKVFEAVTIFDEEYSKLKKNKNVADFSDVEHLALRLLVKRNPQGEITLTDDAQIIADRFDAVMVDEYQDANEVQDLIFRSVSGDGKKLFVVGDVKQSIYGFRQAMPEIFLSRKNSVPLYSADSEEFPSKIILEKNFRSRKEVTDFINFTFSRLMSVKTGDLEYNEEEKLVSAKSFPDTDTPCVEMHLLDLNSIDEQDAVVAEARHIASLILKMCRDTYITHGDTTRLVTPSDIAILMRNPKNYADTYITELKKCGVNAVCENSSGFFTSGEIMLALSFLKVIDNPLEDIPLTCVLMSAVYGFTPDDLAHIKAGDKKRSLYIALCDYAESGDAKSKKFLSDLDYLRDLSLTMPADSFIESLYEFVGLADICSLMYGSESENNLRLLTEYARAYEQGGAKGIGSFVSFTDQLIEEKKDLSASSKVTVHSGTVSLMSIHASKGLEFPVCILANTARQFSTDTADNVLLHSKLGFASKRRDTTMSVSYPTTTREAVALELLRSERSEELRVLYVALTRAKERLVMVATKKNLKRYVTKLSGVLVGDGSVSPFLVRDCKNLSDWLVMCSLLHPNGDELRSYAGFDDVYIPDEGNSGTLKVNIVESLEIESQVSSGVVTSRIVYEDVPENIGDIISERLDYEYPFDELCFMPVKVTASELAHKDAKQKFTRTLRTPLFMNDEKLSYAQRGTATHLFLEKCDFMIAGDDISSEIKKLKSRGILNDAQADSLDIPKLSRFFESEIIDLVKNSSEYHKEYRFTVNVPAYMVSDDLSDTNASQPVILQGAVDLVIVDSDGIVVVDYKTDRVRDANVLAEMYSKQLELYKYALEQIFEMPVRRCLIYSIYLSQIKEVF